tara:strand:- start:76 stop:915 length:840 start_codon:yes stop_codon:yes gene_type:complete
LLGTYPGKSLHRIGVFIAGAWITGNAINLVWPKQSNLNYQNLSKELSLNSIKKELTILIIGLNKKKDYKTDNFKNPNAKYKGTFNFFLLKLDKNKPTKLIKIAPSAKISLFDSEYFLTLDESYRKGDVALASAVIKNIIFLPDDSPQRYIIINRNKFNDLNQILSLSLNSNDKNYIKKKTLSRKDTNYNYFTFRKSNNENIIEEGLSSQEEIDRVSAKIYKINNQKSQKSIEWLPSLIKNLSTILYTNSKTNLSEYEISNIVEYIIKRNDGFVFDKINP